MVEEVKDDVVLEEEDTSEESSPETTDETEEESTSAEDDNTEDSEEVTDEVDAEDKPIPYPRFKKVNDDKKSAIERAEEAEQQLEELRVQIKNPQVMKAMMKSQGYTDDKIKDTLSEQGIGDFAGEPQDMSELLKGLDLNKTEDWIQAIDRISEHKAKQMMAPIQQQVSKSQFDREMDRQKVQANEFCKEFGIDYGDENTDTNNPETGVGKLANYLQANADKRNMISQGYLTKADALKLALAEEGMNFGERVVKENTRRAKLQGSGMETDASSPAGKEPDFSKMSVHETMEYSRRNNK